MFHRSTKFYPVALIQNRDHALFWAWSRLRVVDISASEGPTDLILGLNEAEYASLY